VTYDFRSTRLFVDHALALDAALGLGRPQANYLLNVLRMKEGDVLLVFNGRDGEWRARIAEATRKSCRLEVIEQTRPQPPPYDLHYLFAPLKQARLDYMIQKAVEMGASRITPVLTRHTQVARINAQRMRANAVEAAEQCGILSLPAIDEAVALTKALEAWPPDRQLVFCDELASPGGPLPALARLSGRPLAVLIGPEGGFSREERDDLLSRPFVTGLSLGPRILRADTAAVAALALVQAALGDWR
jgi:16S rRNA (uracil1498-N3)-methyltransferase